MPCCTIASWHMPQENKNFHAQVAINYPTNMLETWLRPSILDNEIFPQNYYLHCTNHMQSGFGGILIGTMINLNSELICF